ncbi:MAG: SRPBCC family protein [Pseudomonadales bacterium]|nr:SRPBCC family protein [Pseudomonadales bacterium]NRA18623.1 SRPBCC family protein [Oceanospirillaceae bacterium]
MKVFQSVKIDSKLKDVWHIFSDMEGIVNYHPWVIRSPLLSDCNMGVGASRRCEFQDNTSVVETITEVREYEYIKMVLSETPVPMISGNVTASFQSTGGGTELTIEMDVKVGLGPLGWIIGPLIMRPIIKNRIKKMALSLDHYIKTGLKLDPKGNIVNSSITLS